MATVENHAERFLAKVIKDHQEQVRLGQVSIHQGFEDARRVMDSFHAKNTVKKREIVLGEHHIIYPEKATDWVDFKEYQVRLRGGSLALPEGSTYAQIHLELLHPQSESMPQGYTGKIFTLNGTVDKDQLKDVNLIRKGKRIVQPKQQRAAMVILHEAILKIAPPPPRGGHVG